MGNDTLINSRSPVTKGSNGLVTTFPDACKTPTPGGPVPIPYPNIGQSSNIASGTSKVTVNGSETFVKGSSISVTSGDEAGSAGGLASSKIKGKAEPIMYSFDVMFEGKNVVRNFDPFTGNDKNTPPAPIMQAQVAPAMGITLQEDKPEKCEYCKKKQHKFPGKSGNNIGSSGTLSQRIFAGKEKADHRWYTGGFSLQAHHVICSESMNNDEWAQLCRTFGYDINRKENGVMLPWKLHLACQLAVPLHRGNHDRGDADHMPYPDKIKQLVVKFENKAKAGNYCSNPDQLTKDLDALSESVLKKIAAFKYTLTAFGRDYKANGPGCGGVQSLRKTKGDTCPEERKHGQKHAGSVLSQHKGSIEIGS